MFSSYPGDLMIPVDAVNSAGLPSPHALMLGSAFKTVYARCNQIIHQFNQFITHRRTQMVTSIATLEHNAHKVIAYTVQMAQKIIE